MTHKELFKNAKWVTPQASCDAALFRYTFDTEKTENAKILISGLGWFELYINGKRVGDDYFVPANSDYHERPDMKLIYPINDKMTHRIYCMQYDISAYLKKGENILGVMVGGGFYRQEMRCAEGNMSYGDIKLCFKIKISEKEYNSDESVVWNQGFFKSSNLFYGEVLDYTDFDRNWFNNKNNEGWDNCISAAEPNVEFNISTCPTDKIHEVLKATLVKNFGDYSVYKIEKNISGYPVIVCEKTGETVIVECAEELKEDLSLDFSTAGGNYKSKNGEFQIQREIFITDGEKYEYRPYFTWFSFKYFSVTNNALPKEVRVIHADVKVTSEFECSDETLNWYYNAYINSQLSNMHSGVPSDCPHRERLGYTGDGQLTCDAAMTQLDAQSFYRKWIQDICDGQDMNSGHVQHTAPFAGGGGGPAGWGGAIIVVPYTFYKHYGDKEFLKKIYPNMEKFVSYIENHCEDGLIVREEEGGWCLGEWCTPGSVKIPEPFVNTTMYIRQLKMLKFCAEALNKSTKNLDALIEYHLKAVTEKYCDISSPDYHGEIQGADAFAVDCGIKNKDILNRLVNKYKNLGRFDTGMFGTDILTRTLFENGEGELAGQLLANKSEVSFENMRRHGATTLWECWDSRCSHNHPMFGAATTYLFSYVLGIKQNESAVCYDEVEISPVTVSFLEYAKGSITTPHGKISVYWKRNGDKVTFNINLCDGVNARFKLGTHSEALNSGENIITYTQGGQAWKNY